jgi:hypothetical protein
MHPTVGAVLEQARRHLTAAGVVHANEEDLGNLFGERALHLSQGLQTLACKAIDEERNKVFHARTRE